MKQPVIDPGQEKPGRQEEITAADIAEGLKCGNPACSCDREGPNGWITHCPAHADGNPSFSVTEAEDGKILVHCHAGCGQSEVIDELKDRRLWPRPAGASNVVLLQSEPKGELLEAYSYRDENDHLLFQSCRYEPKGFRLRRPNGQGGWTYNINDTRLVPYNLPEVLKAARVIIVEGEKDANGLADTGLTATCNPTGALKWRPEYNPHFRGKEVIILPDNDDVGRKHAASVARHLHGTAKSIKILELPGLPEKGDVIDWLQAGGNSDQLLNLAEKVPEWQPNANQNRQTKKEKIGENPKNPRKPHLRAVEPELVLVKSVLLDAPVDHGNPEKTAHHFNLMHVNDLVQQPQPETSWIWDGILPAGGSSINAAKPKVGKSTLCLNLAVAVAKGDTFLGRATVQVPVVYLALEEKGAELQKRLKALGVDDATDLHLHVGMAPENALKEIDALVAATGAGLLIIDTMQKLVRLRDLNDYAQVNNALEPIHEVARARNCHIMLTHHASKAERKDGDEILGSTAILGAVDTAIILKKRDQARTFSTIQRYGDDVPETMLVLNSDYSLTIGATLEEAKEKEVWNKIRTVIEAHPELTEPEIVTQTEGRGADTSRVLRWALNQTPPLVQRHGGGKKGDPFRYFLPPVPPAPIWEGEKQKMESAVTSDDYKQNTPSQILPAMKVAGRGEDLTRLNPECPDHRFEAWDKAIGGMVSDGIVRQDNVRWLDLQQGGCIHRELPGGEVATASQDHQIYNNLEVSHMVH